LVDQATLISLRSLQPDACLVSSRTGQGFDELELAIAERLPRPNVFVQVLIPYNRGELVSRMHLNSEIIKLEYQEHGTYLEARVKEDLAAELKPYLI
jgi:GTP-binding protein HflX